MLITNDHTVMRFDTNGTSKGIFATGLSFAYGMLQLDAPLGNKKHIIVADKVMQEVLIFDLEDGFAAFPVGGLTPSQALKRMSVAGNPRYMALGMGSNEIMVVVEDTEGGQAMWKVVQLNIQTHDHTTPPLTLLSSELPVAGIAVLKSQNKFLVAIRSR